MVYDCSSDGVRRQPFEVWMLDCVGALGVKRLRPEHRRRIPGVIGYCRGKFKQQVPFDDGFRPDDTALYCLELTEKAFRSQGLALSEPVQIGDWEHLSDYPLTTFGFLYGTGLVLDRPITLEQPVYLPGNEHQGMWASPLLEAVFGPGPKRHRDPAPGKADGLSLCGDLELAVFVVVELRRSYAERPLRWLSESRVTFLSKWTGGEKGEPEYQTGTRASDPVSSDGANHDHMTQSNGGGFRGQGELAADLARP